MSSPEQMRAAVAQYVAEIHRAYLAQAMTFPPGVRGQLPLLAPGRLTVAAAGARNLHILATREPLGPVTRTGGRGGRLGRSAGVDAALL